MANQNAQFPENNDVNYIPQPTVEGLQQEVHLTEMADTRSKNILVDTRKIIPIVYIPGMMTTYLIDEKGKNAWAPPSGIEIPLIEKDIPLSFELGGLFSILHHWWFRGASERQTRLDPNATKVNFEGPLRTPKSITRKEARNRGWGAIWKNGDQPFLDKLQWALDHIQVKANKASEPSAKKEDTPFSNKMADTLKQKVEQAQAAPQEKKALIDLIDESINLEQRKSDAHFLQKLEKHLFNAFDDQKINSAISDGLKGKFKAAFNTLMPKASDKIGQTVEAVLKEAGNAAAKNVISEAYNITQNIFSDGIKNIKSADDIIRIKDIQQNLQGNAFKKMVRAADRIFVDGIRSSLDKHFNEIKNKKNPNLIDALIKEAGKLIKKEEERLNGIMATWQTLIDTPPEYYGGIFGEANKAITKEELEQLAKYRFDVWAAGYNWLADCQKATKHDIINRIENTILANYQDRADKPNKVIVITHSMGGVISRTFTQLNEECKNRVWGVSHGCQPSTGAPAAYHHTRCGYEGMAKPIFGSCAKHVSPLIFNAPGSMALLPFPQYQNGQPWLFLHNKKSDTEHEFMAFPQKDIYEEVYKSTEWYGLCPTNNGKTEEENNKFINPAKRQNTETTQNNEMGKTKKDAVVTVQNHKDLCTKLDEAREFQTELHEAGYHPVTYAHAESQRMSRSSIPVVEMIHDFREKDGRVGCWNHVHWSINSGVNEASRNNIGLHTIVKEPIKKDNYKGKVTLTCQSKAKFVSYAQPNEWANPYTRNSLNKWYTLETNNEGSPPTVQPVPDYAPELNLGSYTDIARSGDGTVGAASGEAPFIWGKDGRLKGFFLHGRYPAFAETAKLMQPALEKALKHQEEKKPKMSPFYQASYDHASSYSSDLAFYSTLHAITKIVTQEVKDDDFG